MKTHATILFIFLFVFSIKAQQVDDLLRFDIEELTKIKVFSASMYEKDLFNSPAATSIITREEIEHAPVTNIVELLQYSVSIDAHIKTRTDMDVSTRGFGADEAGKMLVLVNSQPMNTVLYGGMQWPTLPVNLDDINHIEIIRGNSSSTFGTDAILGVINIILKEGSEWKSQVSAAVDERGMIQTRVGIKTDILENFILHTSVFATQTEKKGEEETVDARFVSPNFEIKDHAQILGATVNSIYKFRKTSIKTDIGFTTDEEGYNTSPGDRTIDKSFKNTFFINNIIATKYDNRHVKFRTSFRNLNQNNHKYERFGYVPRYDVDKAYSLDFDLQYELKQSEEFNFIAGAGYSYQEASREINNNTPYLYDKSDMLYSLYLESNMVFLKNVVNLNLFTRIDKWQEIEGQVSPKATLQFIVIPDIFNIRLSAGTSYRRPSFDENYYYLDLQNGWFKGSQIEGYIGDEVVAPVDQSPEKSVNYEVGFKYRMEDMAYFNLVLFHKKVEDLIAIKKYESTSDPYGLYLVTGNTGENVEMNGVEFEGRYWINKYIHGFFNYTGLYGEYEIPHIEEKRWLNPPRHKINIALVISTFINFDLRYRHVDEHIFHEIPMESVKAYNVFDLAISDTFINKLHVKFIIRNLLDTKYYEYPVYTQLRRNFLVTAKYEL